QHKLPTCQFLFSSSPSLRLVSVRELSLCLREGRERRLGGESCGCAHTAVSLVPSRGTHANPSRQAPWETNRAPTPDTIHDTEQAGDRVEARREGGDSVVKLYKWGATCPR
ncbi:unnamed protein product, partial [Pylaiella littoralis]